MKAQDQTDMATLTLSSFGLTPVTSIISGRYLAEGFAVLITSDFFDNLENPAVVGSTNEVYSWRKFASILCTITEGFIGPDCYGAVEVTGVDQIRADILVLSWSYPETDQQLVEWLLVQSDDTLDYLQKHVGSLLDQQNLDVIGEMSSLFVDVHGAGDLLSVFSNESLLASILESLERKSDDLKALKEKRKKNILKPHLSKMRKVIDCYGDDHLRFMRSTTTDLLWHWMENYIESNDGFPKGEHTVVIDGRYNLGMIDFSVE